MRKQQQSKPRVPLPADVLWHFCEDLLYAVIEIRQCMADYSAANISRYGDREIHDLLAPVVSRLEWYSTKGCFDYVHRAEEIVGEALGVRSEESFSRMSKSDSLALLESIISSSS